MKHEVLDELLNEASYDDAKRERLVASFRNGFSLGYSKLEKVKLTAKHLPLQVGDEVDLWNKVMKEVKLKRYAGPYASIPFQDDFIQSPIGLVPKDNGKDTRLIFHLSHPCRRVNGIVSVNGNTPEKLSTGTR